jgi:hypothetical protein
MADPVTLGDFTQQAAPPGSRPSPSGAAQPGTWYIEEAAGGGKLHRRAAPGGRRRGCDIGPRSRSAGAGGWSYGGFIISDYLRPTARSNFDVGWIYLFGYPPRLLVYSAFLTPQYLSLAKTRPWRRRALFGIMEHVNPLRDLLRYRVTFWLVVYTCYTTVNARGCRNQCGHPYLSSAS